MEKASVLGLPKERSPRGWWQVGWSHDVGSGDVRALKYFNQDLVLWRGHSGQLYLQDAFCLHLGAHRGIKGDFTDNFEQVKGDDLMCPWHGWVWNGEGRNTSIPYSKEGCKPHLQIRTYPVQEWYGMILAWWAHDGRDPEWEMPRIDDLEGGEYYPLHPYSSRMWSVKAHCQLVIENAADPAHVAYVHGAGAIPSLEAMDFEGHVMTGTLCITYGAGRESTHLTPEGPVTSRIHFQNHGMGTGFLYWDLPYPTYQLTSITPVDDTYVHYYFQQTSKRLPGDTGDEPKGIAMQMLELQWKVVPQDFFAWENMTYLPRANFAAEEARNYSRLRRWCSQFYPPESLVEVD
jgi:nitrite reductase/ring-hydroxylating ferredoxin subunit